jgi:hypothetical protein
MHIHARFILGFQSFDPTFNSSYISKLVEELLRGRRYTCLGAASFPRLFDFRDIRTEAISSKLLGIVCPHPGCVEGDRSRVSGARARDYL